MRRLLWTGLGVLLLIGFWQTSQSQPAFSIITRQIQDLAITTAKLANGAVTAIKIAAGGTPDSTTCLRGDMQWAACSVSGGGGESVITPSLSASQNDWNPSGLSTATQVRVSLTTSVSITGITAGSNGQRLLITNTNVQYALVLVHENTSSTAANRLNLGQHLVLFAQESAQLAYDSTAARWRLIRVTTNPILRRSYAGSRPNTTTTLSPFGIAATISGTASHPVPATTNYKTALRRTNFATGTVANTLAGYRTATWMANLDSAANRGGFVFNVVWSWSNISGTTQASFIGLGAQTTAMARASIAPGSSCTPQLLGWAFYFNTNNNVNSIWCGSGTTNTFTDLGATNFPANTTAVYQGHIYQGIAQGGQSGTLVLWRDDDLTIAPDVRTVTGTALLNSAFVMPHIWIDNGSGAAANSIDVMRSDIWTP
jgi:hypothetical protein